jgi:translation initiation factor eIF-2B subunit gamma
VINGDFIVLPCDLVCELGGESLLEAWMVKEAGFGGATGGCDAFKGPKMAIGGEKGGRRGGLGVWYSTKGELAVKDEETDFVTISPLASGPVPPPQGSLLPNVSNLVYSLPTDTLNDIVEKRKTLPIRHSLLRKHPRIKMLTKNRDAHLYIFPVWVLDMINRNEHMESLSEDVIGWWAKAGWQEGLGDNLGLREVFDRAKISGSDDGIGGNAFLDGDIDIGNLTTTQASKFPGVESLNHNRNGLGSQKRLGASDTKTKLLIPPILAYIHPVQEKKPLIRRVDTAPLLLLVSLQLAKLESIEQIGRHAASPFAHVAKISYPAGIASRCTVTKADCLLAENVTVEEKCAIKECVIGANCHIQSGAKLTRCLLMDGVVVGKGCKLNGSILGRRAEIGDESILQDCEVEDYMRIEPKSE